MKWEVIFRIKDSIRSWSDQTMDTSYDGVAVHIEIKDLECRMELEGEKKVLETFYLIWELLFLYDGYFYEPVFYTVDEKEIDAESLIRLKFYSTDKKWYSSALLGRNERNLSAEVIEKYAEFRNAGMADKKMTKSVVNAFYYLHSNAYKDINSNHRISLLLNIADGWINNTFKETNNVKANLDRLFKKTVDIEKIKRGIALFGIPEENFRYNLAQERHALDHYLYLADSIAAFAFNSTDHVRDYITWYFIYVIGLVIRINFLKEAGVGLKQEVMDYAMDQIADWVIVNNDLDEDCLTPGYQMEQMKRRLAKKN